MRWLPRRRWRSLDCGVSIECDYWKGILIETVGHRSPATPITGDLPGEGTYYCLGCGMPLALRESEALPECDRCGGSRFRRDSIFTAMRGHGTSTAELSVPLPAERPLWLEEARQTLHGPGPHLVAGDEDVGVLEFPIDRGWTRIGRSPTADVCLDDPSVSRRHAMLVAEPGQRPRVFDDRSLNGILLNGEKVEWGQLRDGDELTVGRYRLYFLSA